MTVKKGAEAQNRIYQEAINQTGDGECARLFDLIPIENQLSCIFLVRENPSTATTNIDHINRFGPLFEHHAEN